jgi:hypothetical protein
MMLATLVLVGTALCGEGRPAPSFEEEEVPPMVSITVEPLRLMPGPMHDLGRLGRVSRAPALAGTFEVRMGRAGSFAIRGARPFQAQPGAPVEAGVQLREYVLGDFGNGIALGARADFENPRPLALSAEKTTFGPFVSAKLTLAIFTVEARGGPALSIGAKGVTVAPAVDVSAGVSF